MHIERIHNSIEKLAECFESELNKGTENVSAEEIEKVAKTICSLADAEYKSRVSKAMEEAEEEEKLMQKMGMGDEERRFYRGQPRNEQGQYKEDGRRNRYYNRHLEPEMYSADMYGFMPEDMRRMPMYYDGRMNGNGNTTTVDNGNNARVQYSMGYSDGESNGYRRGYNDGNGNNNGNGRTYTEGKSGMARRRYYEEKEKHSANTTQDKEVKLKELEKYMAELASDITEMLSEETQEGRQMIKNKLTTLANKI